MSATASTEQQLGIQLPVKGFRAQGAGDAFVGLAAAATQYFLAGFFLALAVNPSIYSAEPTAGGRVVAVAFAIAAYAFGRWGRRQIRRAATLDARLVVMPDCVIVRHGGLLTGPVMIPGNAWSRSPSTTAGRRSPGRRIGRGSRCSTCCRERPT
jgi:hypothetical protein